MGFMRAGEDPEKSNPANKTARDHASPILYLC